MAAAMVHQFRLVAQEIGLGVGTNSDVPKVVTMASIVEKETAAPDERPLVASVYYNRLAQKMALDADPSVIYAELLAGTYQGSLHHADMAVNSPYNTYRFPGLPPGPIGNPGKSSLQRLCTPRTQIFFISLPMATDTTVLPAASKSTIETWPPIVARSTTRSARAKR
jgi:UPF0755 protein